MANQCPECKLDVMEAQVSLRFDTKTSTEDKEDWSHQDVIAGICPQCGRMNFRIAKPKHFTKWLLEKQGRQT